MNEEYKHIGICEQCGKESRYKYKSWIRRFCSPTCQCKWVWAHKRVGERSVMVHKKCLNCGKELILKPKERRAKTNSPKVFCSRECSAAYIAQQYNKPCVMCGKMFHNVHSKTCSHECSVKYRTLRLYQKKIGNASVTYQDYVNYCRKQREERNRRIALRKSHVNIYKGREKEYLKEYHQRTKELRNAKRKERFANDPVAAFKALMRKRMCNWFRRKKFPKKSSTEQILGCSFDEFKKYIASLFKDGMTWDNYGEWQLDHIIPLSTAKNIEDVERLCHYTNLQPLWAKDNLEKRAKIPQVQLRLPL